ncbi:MAG: hypothetical protein WBR18_12215 [Anaerolineales bacterium]
MRKRTVLAMVMLALLTSCRGLAPKSDAPTLSEPFTFNGMDESALGPHAANFDLSFDSDDPWAYSVRTRVSEDALERALHIDGVSDARNPGDVRMVTESGISRMRGPGTEDECLRFPDTMNVNLSFLNPDDVLLPGAFREPLVAIDQEPIAGRSATHFAMLQDELDGWQEVQVGLWIDNESGAVLRYDLAASGWDPFFGGGFGRMEGSYQVESLGSQTIEPIAGCQVGYPLPDQVEGLVKLPGVVAFETPMTVDDTVAFYRDALVAAGWNRDQEEARSSGAVVLSYRREGESINVTIRDTGNRTKVELLIN